MFHNSFAFFGNGDGKRESHPIGRPCIIRNRLRVSANILGKQTWGMETRSAAKDVKDLGGGGAAVSRSPESWCWLAQTLKMASGLAQAPCPLPQMVIRIFS